MQQEPDQSAGHAQDHQGTENVKARDPMFQSVPGQRNKRCRQQRDRCPLPGVLEVLQQQEFDERSDDADDQGDKEELSKNSWQRSEHRFWSKGNVSTSRVYRWGRLNLGPPY